MSSNISLDTVVNRARRVPKLASNVRLTNCRKEAPSSFNPISKSCKYIKMSIRAEIFKRPKLAQICFYGISYSFLIPRISIYAHVLGNIRGEAISLSRDLFHSQGSPGRVVKRHDGSGTNCSNVTCI